MKSKRSIITITLLTVAISVVAKPNIIAHRGFWKTYGSAQNSISSLIKADSIGAYAAEFDVWLTADDSLVVNHDAVFQNVDIEKSDYAKIRNIHLDNGEIIPALSEYLMEAQKHPRLNLILELKSLNSPEREHLAALKIANMLSEYDLLSRTTIISFSLNACNSFSKLLPKSEIYYLNGDLTPKEIKDLGFTGIDYSGDVLKAHPEWVQESHELGLKVNVWTIDDDESLKYFKGLGADYITTNEPIKALEIFNID